jgi:diadenosine tetraphosphatase ApaH/serine/threonine PP2A family protein phosphatase
MIWAILSDVHGNLEALQAVLADCRREGTRRLIFLGDAVGYGADPGECLALIRDRAGLQIAGNHDRGAVGLTDIDFFNPPARIALEWTTGVLSEESRAFLRRLPLTLEAEGFTLVHAAIPRPAEWNYILTADDAEESFQALRGQAVFCGHSHRPLVVARGKEGRPRHLEREAIVFEEGVQYLVNSGSVGQPRDHDPLAAYGLYDDETRQYRLKRVPYDIPRAQEKILRAGLPPSLARRLAYGQ